MVETGVSSMGTHRRRGESGGQGQQQQQQQTWEYGRSRERKHSEVKIRALAGQSTGPKISLGTHPDHSDIPPPCLPSSTGICLPRSVSLSAYSPSGQICRPAAGCVYRIPRVLSA